MFALVGSPNSSQLGIDPTTFVRQQYFRRLETQGQIRAGGQQDFQLLVPVAEKIRYVTTGTEATMYSVRLARAITGKKIIAKVDGGWHGYTTDLLKTVNYPFNESESKGLTDEQHIISIPYNNIQKSLQILKAVKKDLAGVVIEPVLGGGGAIPATKDYLKAIQEFAKSNNSKVRKKLLHLSWRLFHTYTTFPFFTVLRCI